MVYVTCLSGSTPSRCVVLMTPSNGVRREKTTRRVVGCVAAAACVAAGWVAGGAASSASREQPASITPAARIAISRCARRMARMLLLRRLLRGIFLVHRLLDGDFFLRRGRDGELRAAGFGPVEVEEVAARLVGALVRVGAEVIALGLQEVRGEARGAVAVVVGE